MMKYLYLFIGLWLFSAPLHAQTAEENFYDAVFFYEDEQDYKEAQYLFQEVLKKEPNNANVKFLLGMCYNHIQGEEYRGIPYFLDATRSISLKYKGNKFSEKRAPHHTWFYLAEAYSKINQMDDALDALNRFRDLEDFESRYNARITEEAVLAVERAKIIKDAEIKIRALYFNEPINSPSDDYNGVISGDGRMMVWANSKTFYEAVYMSIRQNSKWGVPVLITPQIVSDGDLLPTGLSFDGTTLLLVKTERRNKTDIWVSTFNGNVWSPAKPIEGEINTGGREDHASFSPDGRVIYFSSDRRGGEGGLDLWYSERQRDGTWGRPVNMGEGINTDKDETSVFLAPSGERLIFASKGHFNMGGYDIFRCELEENGTWSQPTNIGYPLNTTGDNTFYVPVNNGLQALYTRFTNEAIGRRDLWYVEILDRESMDGDELTLAVEPAGISEKDFAIILVNEDSGEEIEVLYDAETDSFKALAGEKTTYKVISYKQK
jgi:dipeptidyl aminopeptidase/acylaminoacyl peptidase